MTYIALNFAGDGVDTDEHERMNLGEHVAKFTVAWAFRPWRCRVEIRRAFGKINSMAMHNYQVKVIDGPLPPGVFQAGDMEPDLSTAPEHTTVMMELMLREPLFHRPEFGTSRADFEKMTAPEFWEVGASGRRYSRSFCLNCLVKRYENPIEDSWEIKDFHCVEIAIDNYLVTYTLIQGERITQRATIWRRISEDWQIVYHQGTSVEKRAE